MYRARVLVLERANRRINRIMRMPAGYSKYIDARPNTYLEMHQSVPASNLNGRAPIVPQAKVLGGGSAVNAMVYARGQAKDYDDWDTYLGGNSGWAYEDVLPAFKNIENNARLNDAFHGVGGPLDVTDVSHVSEMTEAFILSGRKKSAFPTIMISMVQSKVALVPCNTRSAATNFAAAFDVMRPRHF